MNYVFCTEWENDLASHEGGSVDGTVIDSGGSLAAFRFSAG